MRNRYFMFKSLQASQHIVDKYHQLEAERTEILKALEKDFNLVGFSYNSDGSPRYLLKELLSDFDEDRFRAGRINVAGNDFTGLEPIDEEIVKLCKSAAHIRLIDVVTSMLPFQPQTHLHSEPSPEVKLCGSVVMVKIQEYNDLKFEPSDKLVEMPESLYNEPIVRLLEKQLTE